MSRIGKKEIKLPDGVSMQNVDGVVTIKGAKTSLNKTFIKQTLVTVEQADDKTIVVKRKNDGREARCEQGLVRSLINNMVKGVSEGFERDLEINGVGYRAAVKGKVLELSLGFSHPVNFEIPEGITIKADGPTKLKVSGADLEKVGETAARIRRLRPPEPYKGKGVKYADEVIRRKAGKSAAKAG